MNSTCSKCGGTDPVQGKLVGLGAGFKPDKLKFWTVNQEIPISARMCRKCGHIDFIGDIERLEKISSEDKIT